MIQRILGIDCADLTTEMCAFLLGLDFDDSHGSAIHGSDAGAKHTRGTGADNNNVELASISNEFLSMGSGLSFQDFLAVFGALAPAPAAIGAITPVAAAACRNLRRSSFMPAFSFFSVMICLLCIDCHPHESTMLFAELVKLNPNLMELLRIKITQYIG